MTTNTKYYIGAGLVVLVGLGYVFKDKLAKLFGMKKPAKADPKKNPQPEGVKPGSGANNPGNDPAKLWDTQVAMSIWAGATNRLDSSSVPDLTQGANMETAFNNDVWRWYVELGGDVKSNDWTKMNASMATELQKATGDEREEMEAQAALLVAQNKIPRSYAP